MKSYRGLEVGGRFHASVADLAGKELVILSKRLGITHNRSGSNNQENVVAGNRIIVVQDIISVHCNPVFLNRRAAARYRALASIIPGRERFSWNLSF